MSKGGSKSNKAPWGGIIVTALVVGAVAVYFASDKSRRAAAAACVKESAENIRSYAKKASNMAGEIINLLPCKKNKEKTCDENNPWQEVDLFLNENN